MQQYSIRPTVMRVAASVVLAVPALLLGTPFAAAFSGRVPGIGVVAFVVLVGAMCVGLHVIAVRAANSLGSDRLPWTLWALTTGALWIAVAGVFAIGIHFANVDAGVDDSALIVPAAVVAIVGISAVVAAIIIAGIVLSRVLHTRNLA